MGHSENPMVAQNKLKLSVRKNEAGNTLLTDWVNAKRHYIIKTFFENKEPPPDFLFLLQNSVLKGCKKRSHFTPELRVGFAPLCKYSFCPRRGMFFHSLINMAVIQSRPRDAKPLLSPLSPCCQILPVTSIWPFAMKRELPRSDPKGLRKDKQKMGGSEKNKKSRTKIITKLFRCLLPFLLVRSHVT